MSQAPEADQSEHDRVWATLGNLENNQTRISTVLEGVVGRLKKNEENVQAATRSRLQAIGVATTVIIFVLGSFFSIMFYTYSEGLQHVIYGVEHAQQERKDHMSDGHPQRVMERVDAISAEIEDIENQLRDLVPRDEHETRWKMEDDQMRQHMTDMAMRINRLEERLFSRPI